MLPHSATGVDIAFRVDQHTGSLLWLEYREPAARWPNPFALGTIRAPLPATFGVGDAQ